MRPEADRSDERLLSGAEQIELIERVLERGQTVELPVRGGCMRPWASSGDVLVIEAVAAPLRIGMILLIRVGDDLLAHRLVRYKPGMVRTRGDLAASLDPWIGRGRVLGRIVAVRSHHGRVLNLDGAVPELVGLSTAPAVRLVARVVRALRSAARRWAGGDAAGGA